MEWRRPQREPHRTFHCLCTPLLRLFFLGILCHVPVTTCFPVVSSPHDRGALLMRRASYHHHRDDRNPLPAPVATEPLYITIGTQCCGKTTFLKQSLPPSTLDISLDDQPDVYVSVDTQLFLRVVATSKATNTDTQTDIYTDPRLLQCYQGKTLLERIRHDNTELTLVLQRFHGDLSSETFASAIREHFATQRFPSSLAQLLIDGVEQESCFVPSHVQVFVLESLFQPHPSTNQSAIERAHRLLRQTPPHIPVAWGNTNSKSRDYQQALDIAWETRRPVRFVVQGRDLAHVPLSQLLRRNLQRWSRTGKYIPAVAMEDCQGRISRLLSEAGGIHAPRTMTTATAGRFDEDAAWALDQRLVQMAEPRGSQYRYHLTKNRLIHKEGMNSNNAHTRYHQGPTRPPTNQPVQPNKRPRPN